MLLHSAKFGIVAVVGVIVGLYLGWPNELIEGAGGRYDIDYQKRLGMTSAERDSSYMLAFFCAVFGELVGVAVGALLVKLAMVSEENLKIE